MLLDKRFFFSAVLSLDTNDGERERERERERVERQSAYGSVAHNGASVRLAVVFRRDSGKDTREGAGNGPSQSHFQVTRGRMREDGAQTGTGCHGSSWRRPIPQLDSKG